MPIQLGESGAVENVLKVSGVLSMQSLNICGVYVYRCVSVCERGILDGESFLLGDITLMGCLYFTSPHNHIPTLRKRRVTQVSCALFPVHSPMSYPYTLKQTCTLVHTNVSIAVAVSQVTQVMPFPDIIKTVLYVFLILKS